MQLTQKEKMLLKDQQNHEEICIEKYTNYARQVQDPQLQQLFTNYAQQERQHYQTIGDLLNGQQPRTNQPGQQLQQGQQQQARSRQQAQASSGMVDENDKQLLNDMLMTEKYISSTYDTAVFEAANPTVRQALQHIQKEEQQHGEGIFNYMNQHGMYQPQ